MESLESWLIRSQATFYKNVYETQGVLNYEWKPLKILFGDIIIENFGSSNGKKKYGENMCQNEQMNFLWRKNEKTQEDIMK